MIWKALEFAEFANELLGRCALGATLAQCRLDNAVGKWQLARMVEKKLDNLRALLGTYRSCLVAYSGGVDSVFLAWIAHEVLRDRSLAVIADSPSLPRRELDEALALGEKFRFPVRVIHTHEFSNPNYTSNPNNRCYFCKHELFEQLLPIAKAEGFSVIAYGENATDLGDYRPGAQAAAEFEVRAPLKEVGLTKAEIRELSAQLGLPTADKAQMACLSSRIPYGEPVTPEKLAMVEQAENVLRDLGFHDVRVRHHELKVPGAKCHVPSDASDSASKLATHLARIEVGASELPRLLEGGLSAQVAETLKKIGYAYVTVDLQGYRRGSLNERSLAQISS